MIASLDYYANGPTVRCNITVEKAPTKLYGDVDLDGDVDAGDAILVAYYASGFVKLSDQAKANADVNLDKKIDMNDAYIILYYVFGISPYNKLPYTK